MKRRRLTADEELRIAQRIRDRRDSSTQNLMAEYQCSRSLIDRISRQLDHILTGANVLHELATSAVPRESKQNACTRIGTHVLHMRFKDGA